MNFYKHYIGDYQRDTGTLSLAEHGAYRLMLDELYATGSPLPNDRKELYRLLRCDSAADRKAVDKVASRFWAETDEGLVNRRALAEIQKAGAQAEVNRAIALEREAKKRAASEARSAAQKEHESCTDLFNDVSTNRSTNNQPNHSHSQNKEKKHSSVPDAIDPGFVQFWETWPKTDRKTAKAECAKRWKARGLEDMAATIIADVASRKQTRQWQEGFEPAPLTYLNQRRWEDSSVGEPDPFR